MVSRSLNELPLLQLDGLVSYPDDICSYLCSYPQALPCILWVVHSVNLPELIIVPYLVGTSSERHATEAAGLGDRP